MQQLSVRLGLTAALVLTLSAPAKITIAVSTQAAESDSSKCPAPPIGFSFNDAAAQIRPCYDPCYCVPRQIFTTCRTPGFACQCSVQKPPASANVSATRIEPDPELVP